MRRLTATGTCDYSTWRNGLNMQRAGAIYEDMLHYRKFPDNLFAASFERKEALRKALRRR